MIEKSLHPTSLVFDPRPLLGQQGQQDRLILPSRFKDNAASRDPRRRHFRTRPIRDACCVRVQHRFTRRDHEGADMHKTLSVPIIRALAGGALALTLVMGAFVWLATPAIAGNEVYSSGIRCNNKQSGRHPAGELGRRGPGAGSGTDRILRLTAFQDQMPALGGLPGRTAASSDGQALQAPDPRPLLGQQGQQDRLILP